MIMYKTLLILPIFMVAHLPSLAEEWEAILTATSSNTGVEAQKLVFKTVAESTSGFDAGKDIPAPPKAPAPVKLDAFFPVAGNLFISRLRVDARPPEESVSWKFTLQADQDGGSLDWDVSQIPSDYKITLIDDNTIIDMRAIDATPYLVGTQIYTITVEKVSKPTNHALTADSQSISINEDIVTDITLKGSNGNNKNFSYQ